MKLKIIKKKSFTELDNKFVMKDMKDRNQG